MLNQDGFILLTRTQPIRYALERAEHNGTTLGEEYFSKANYTYRRHRGTQYKLIGRSDAGSRNRCGSHTLRCVTRMIAANARRAAEETYLILAIRTLGMVTNLMMVSISGVMCEL
jgi:hypothetical protein